MRNSQKIEFKNNRNEKLAARLELPKEDAEAFALFAHCFTCNKDIAAASRISRGLTEYGIAVMRFDFTGLGNSDGDFSNTNFSSNIEDLRCAINFLEQEHQSPKFIIGHSLGGAAALAIAPEIESFKAVVTIGSPSDITHVSHLFEQELKKIQTDGVAEVNLSGRKFTIKKQFIDDIQSFTLEDKISKLHKALLIFHSPQDNTVSIDHAKNIYLKAKHPKSFISLNGADHLLTNRDDADYVSRVISAWARRYL